MKQEHKEIIEIISNYLEKYPDIRFGQALRNLDVTQYNYNTDVAVPVDNYNDSDKEILKRMKNYV